MSTENFPVVDERPLLRVEQRWFRGPWRDPALLPALPPGCIYVFAGGDDKYTQCRAPEKLRGTEPEFVHARWASMVNVRRRQIIATTWLPAIRSTDDFFVRAVFGCQVTAPETVAELSLTDLQAVLDARLRHDDHLNALQGRFDIDQIADARAAVLETFGDACRKKPPVVTGMEITFEGVHVSTRRELRDHHTELRKTTWDRAVEKLREEHELERVEHVEKLLTSPMRTEAAAIARKERTTGEAAERTFRERDLRTERLIEQVKAWIDADGGKRAPVDRRHLADELFRQLTGEDALRRLPDDLAHTNGHAAPTKNGPLIPPDDMNDGI